MLGARSGRDSPARELMVENTWRQQSRFAAGNWSGPVAGERGDRGRVTTAQRVAIIGMSRGLRQLKKP